MAKRDPFMYFKISREIIRLAVIIYVRFPLSLLNVEDLSRKRGIDVSHEAIQFWWVRFDLPLEYKRSLQNYCKSIT